MAIILASDEDNQNNEYDPYQHDCYYTETPDGYGCPRCIYG